MFFEQNVMNQKSISPYVYFWAVRLLSEELRRHEDGGADDILVYLFFDGKAEISEFIDHVAGLSFVEDIVGFDVSVNDFSFGDEL